MKILFPSKPFEPKVIDPDFTEELEAAKLAGFGYALYDHDALVRGEPINTSWNSTYMGGDKLIIRGWMMNDSQYSRLHKALTAVGHTVINTPEQYANAHIFPYAYSKSKTIRDTSPRTWWSTETDQDFTEYKKQSDGVKWDMVKEFLGGGKMILKDYVKSVKDKPELHILEKELTEADINDRIQLFLEARGKLFTKGLVFKQFVDLKKYDGLTNEWRVFLFRGQLLSCRPNSFTDVKGKPFSMPLQKAIDISKEIGSNFMTVDLAEKEDGEWNVLECGDGQVSGLTSTEKPFEFYNRLKVIIDETT